MSGALRWRARIPDGRHHRLGNTHTTKIPINDRHQPYKFDGPGRRGKRPGCTLRRSRMITAAEYRCGDKPRRSKIWRVTSRRSSTARC